MLKNQLKFTLSFLLISCISFSCSKFPKSEIQEAIEKVIIPQLDDPSSYEFASLQVLDTIRFCDNIQIDRDHFTSMINSSKKNIEYYKGRKGGIIDYEENLSNYTQLLEAVNATEKQLGETANNIAAFYCEYKFRFNNSHGQPKLHTLYIQITPKPDFEILAIKENEQGKLLNAPGNYPGRNDIEDQLKKYDKLLSLTK